MVFQNGDRVRETSTTTGTGTYNLDGAATVGGITYRTFVAGVGGANTCHYLVEMGADWEEGIGTVTDATPDTLARTTILGSSNGGAAVSWVAGTKNVMCVPLALRAGLQPFSPFRFIVWTPDGTNVWTMDGVTGERRFTGTDWAAQVNSILDVTGVDDYTIYLAENLPNSTATTLLIDKSNVTLYCPKRNTKVGAGSVPAARPYCRTIRTGGAGLSIHRIKIEGIRADEIDLHAEGDVQSWQQDLEAVTLIGCYTNDIQATDRRGLRFTGAGDIEHVTVIDHFSEVFDAGTSEADPKHHISFENTSLGTGHIEFLNFWGESSSGAGNISNVVYKNGGRTGPSVRFSGSMVMIGSAGDRAFSQVWQVDDSAGPAFVDETTDANSAGANDWAFFPATEAVADWAAFGLNQAYGLLRLNVGTAGVGGVVVWEYWNGSAWAALSGVTDSTTSLTVAGTNTVTFTMPTNWARSVINGSASLYYLRARVTTVYTTNPLGTQGFASSGVPSDCHIMQTNVGTPTQDAGPNTFQFLSLHVECQTTHTVLFRINANAGGGSYFSIACTYIELTTGAFNYDWVDELDDSFIGDHGLRVTSGLITFSFTTFDRIVTLTDPNFKVRIKDIEGWDQGPTHEIVTISLAADHSISSTTATEVTGLKVANLPPGRYVAEYFLIVQSGTSGTGLGLGINFTGTTTRVVMRTEYSDSGGLSIGTGTMDDLVVNPGNMITGTVARALTTTAPNLVSAGVATTNVDIMVVLYVIIEVSTVGDLQLWHSSETAVATTVESGSSVRVTRMN